MIFVLALDNLGVDIATLVAGLGTTGLAVGLAVQNILGDVFVALSIVLDKPFVVGDQIQVDNFSGTVEHIGLKSTRVRSVSGEQIIFSNADLLKGCVRNFKRMYERRIVLCLESLTERGPDTEDRDGEIADARAVTELRNEITALRAEIRPLEID